MRLLRAVLTPTRIQPQRLRMDWVSAGQGERYARLVQEMAATLRPLGPMITDND